MGVETTCMRPLSAIIGQERLIGPLYFRFLRMEPIFCDIHAPAALSTIKQKSTNLFFCCELASPHSLHDPSHKNNISSFPTSAPLASLRSMRYIIFISSAFHRNSLSPSTNLFIEFFVWQRAADSGASNSSVVRQKDHPPSHSCSAFTRHSGVRTENCSERDTPCIFFSFRGAQNFASSKREKKYAQKYHCF